MKTRLARTTAGLILGTSLALSGTSTAFAEENGSPIVSEVPAAVVEAQAAYDAAIAKAIADRKAAVAAADAAFKAVIRTANNRPSLRALKVVQTEALARAKATFEAAKAAASEMPAKQKLKAMRTAEKSLMVEVRSISKIKPAFGSVKAAAAKAKAAAIKLANEDLRQAEAAALAALNAVLLENGLPAKS